MGKLDTESDQDLSSAHRLLTRQLKKARICRGKPPDPEGWTKFVRLVNASYEAADKDRYTLERSLNISSEEMQDLYKQLKKNYEDRQQAIFTALPDLLFLIDEDGRYLEVTGNENLLYSDKDYLLNRLLHEVLPKDKADMFFQAIQDCLRQNRLTTIEYELEISSNLKYFEGRLSPANVFVKGKRTVILLAIDNTEKKQVIMHDRLVSHIIEAAREGMAIMDEQRRIISVNRAFCEILGKEKNELMGTIPQFLGKTADQNDNIWNRVDESGSWLSEISSRRADGVEFLLWLTLETISDPKENTTHYAAILTDVSEIKRSREELEHVATHDALTGLPNRLLFEDRLHQALARAKRNSLVVALFFLDLDRFKVVNDNLGHQMGDELLLQVSQRLACVQREEDTLARFGGDEFLIISEGLHQAEDATVIARNIMSVFEVPFVLGEYKLDVATSIGISIYPNDTDNAEMLLKNADAAMYHAKKAETSSYQFCTQDLTTNAFKYFSLEISIKKALAEKQFFLHYQPQYEIASGRMIGVEVLLRWQHPEMGLVPPDTFIPVAESTGLIKPLGEWVIRSACQQIKQWDAEGLPSFAVAINVSRRQLTDLNFCEKLESVLREHHLQGERIEVEITESAIIDNEEIAYQNLQQLHDMGVFLSIDDFGTGHSSLANLKRFPLDRLKIDRHFVRDLMVDRNDEAIIKATIALARSFNLQVIAEGVETVEQKNFLLREGCDQVQGYLYSRPVLPTEIVNLLHKRL